MKKFNLPVNYAKLTGYERRQVREQYITEQNGLCYFCNHDLNREPAEQVLNKQINWNLFPTGFLKYPVHLQHDHHTLMTEGAVHAYCNAVMWQYYGK